MLEHDYFFLTSARSIIITLTTFSILLVATEVSAKVDAQAERYPQIITADYIEQIGREKIENTLNEQGEMRNFEIELARTVSDLRAPIGKLTYRVVLGKGIHYGGLTPASVQIIVDGRLFRTVSCFFTVHVFDTILVAAHDLRLETTVNENDFVLQEREIFSSTEVFMIDPTPIIGKVPVRIIKAGYPVTERLFQNPVAIETGMPVMIVARFNGVSVRTEGIALQRGRVGGYIKVKNVNTSKVLRAKVIDEKTVEVV